MDDWVNCVLTMILVVTTSNNVFAKPEVETQPSEPEKAIVVELNDDYFNPKEINIPSGKSTTLKLMNKGKKEHTFTVEALGIDAEVLPGKERTITVKPDKPGTYELICRYHEKQGMVGKVVVQ
ncbi:cupredoxin domain-containing protein [Bacillus carboniphilus]|uniref:Cupredoxin domain-containing protein n=1 Tax=Bacillus carboniphilus TaxID=86663 RepID=A0ABN0WPP8_9BACI